MKEKLSLWREKNDFRADNTVKMGKSWPVMKYNKEEIVGNYIVENKIYFYETEFLVKFNFHALKKVFPWNCYYIRLHFLPWQCLLF